MKQEVTVNSLQEFKGIVRDFTNELKGGELIYLQGQLGAGKTTFVQELGKTLGIKTIISSPTYTIMKEYDNKLCHIDAYRIYDEDIGIDEYLDAKFIVCVEWAEHLQGLNYVPDYVVDIIVEGNEKRKLIFKKGLK